MYTGTYKVHSTIRTARWDPLESAVTITLYLPMHHIQCKVVKLTGCLTSTSQSSGLCEVSTQNFDTLITCRSSNNNLIGTTSPARCLVPLFSAPHWQIKTHWSM